MHEHAHRDNLQAFERVPRTVVESVEMNTSMAEAVRGPLVKQWLEKDYILNNGLVFSFAAREGELWLPQEPRSFRAVALTRDQIYTDEYDNQYSSVTAKGTGFSIPGIYDQSSISRTLPDEKIREIFSSGNNDRPYGLFGYNHAKNEMNVSEMLAAEGARVGRVLGIISLRHDGLRNWAQLHDKKALYSLDAMLSLVEENGDQAAVLFRLTGTDRLDNYFGNNTGYYSQQLLLSRGANLLLREVDIRGEIAFSERYCIDDLESVQINLQNIRKGNYSHTDLIEYGNLLNYLILINFYRKEDVSNNYFGGKLNVYTNTHDVDFAGYMYDWENALTTIENGMSWHLSNKYNYVAPFLTSQENAKQIELIQKNFYKKLKKNPGFYRLKKE